MRHMWLCSLYKSDTERSDSLGPAAVMDGRDGEKGRWVRGGGSPSPRIKLDKWKCERELSQGCVHINVTGGQRAVTTQRAFQDIPLLNGLTWGCRRPGRPLLASQAWHVGYPRQCYHCGSDQCVSVSERSLEEQGSQKNCWSVSGRGKKKRQVQGVNPFIVDFIVVIWMTVIDVSTGWHKLCPTWIHSTLKWAVHFGKRVQQWGHLYTFIILQESVLHPDGPVALYECSERQRERETKDNGDEWEQTDEPTRRLTTSWWCVEVSMRCWMKGCWERTEKGAQSSGV